MMLTLSLFVRLEAKPGKEEEVAAFLKQGLQLANQETTTPLWFALRLSKPRSPSSTRLRRSRPSGAPQRTDRRGAHGAGAESVHGGAGDRVAGSPGSEAAVVRPTRRCRRVGHGDHVSVPPRRGNTITLRSLLDHWSRRVARLFHGVIRSTSGRPVVIVIVLDGRG